MARRPTAHTGCPSSSPLLSKWSSKVSIFPSAPGHRGGLLIQPRYEPSSLLRIGPPQCSASVLSPRGFRRFSFSLGIRATGSCSSAQKPASDSRPLHAGRRLPSHQAPDRLVPEGLHAPGFDDAMLLYDASSKGSLSFVSRMFTCPRSSLSFSSNAHHHGSLPQQLGVV